MPMSNKLINFIKTTISIVVLLFAGWMFKDKSLLITILLLYTACLVALYPFHNAKYIQWIIAILTMPFVLLKPLIHNLEVIMVTLVGIFSFYCFIDIIIRLCENIGIVKMSGSLIQYSSMTISFILATQTWYKKVIDKTTNRYHSEYKNMEYQTHFAKYLIFVFYFVALFISYIYNFAPINNDIGNTSVLLASFATFIAYDRLISHKQLLENSKLILKKSEIIDNIVGNANIGANKNQKNL